MSTYKATQRERAVFVAAEAVHRALCRLEDELDALDVEDPLDSSASSLRMVLDRWHHDSERKILRELERRGLST